MEKDEICSFSTGLLIFQLAICGGEVIFHILKINFGHIDLPEKQLLK